MSAMGGKQTLGADFLSEDLEVSVAASHDHTIAEALQAYCVAIPSIKTPPSLDPLVAVAGAPQRRCAV